ncbi:hypothetical protein ACTWP5_23770 [Streptomyces sp. 4N509B]
MEAINAPRDVRGLAETRVDSNCGVCGGSGWVTVHKDGATIQEKCPVCNV